MQTQLSKYCPRFDCLVRPLLTPLGAAHDALDAGGPAALGRELRSLLADVRHHLTVLCDKVQAQQAYVLIFGPLKSGKSTLMNAVAGAYVSEVSSLPAYPCLVFVGPGQQRHHVVTQYDGQQQTFASAQTLHRHIEQAHTSLAAAIRTAEQRGAAFDPQEHFPQAIRRVDVQVPSKELAQTSAVLVDTPGLYTRMRFGYDRMTRDFRDAAACAIFVVKSDTLFLEQVFAEFHQLLDLFSRIFLVVNVDSQKRDVGPDGRLVPSLEQSQPEAVLAAFERLAMSAPLQAAAAAGRVRMYPVDLLHAASSTLQKEPADKAPKSFVRFRQDLADYLASADYLAAFLRDSLQRAQALTGELEAALQAAPVRRLQARVGELEQHVAFVQTELQRLDRALQHDLTPSFQKGDKVLQDELERSARDCGQKLLRTLGASIDTWFLSSHSLHWLCAGQWTPLLHDYRLDVERQGRRALEQSIAQPAAGIELPDEVLRLCDRLGIDLRAVRQQALAALGALPADAGLRVPVAVAAIPVRRGVLDLVTFRSHERVRLRLFGDPERPDAKIPGKDKAARLGEAGRLHLHQCVTQFRAALAPATVQALRQHLGTRLQQATIAELQRRLRLSQPQLEEKLAELQQELQRLRAVLLPLLALQAATVAVRQQLPLLAQQFAVPVTQPPAREVVLEPQPRREPKAADVPVVDPRR